jgi:lipopolysaccharide biosynthesis glycosyltransferase
MQLHLAIAFDQNYLHPFYALLQSIFESHQGSEVHIHAVATGVSSSVLEQITKQVTAKGHHIYYYNIDDNRLGDFITMSTWTSAVYYRLYFPLMIPETVDRLLYIDTDTLVLKNLSPLFEYPLTSSPVAAVDDNYVDIQPLLGITKSGEYFNSGVLLIDVNEWKKQRISERTMEYLLQYPERIKFVDQCGLNAVLHHNWKRLDKRFNFIYSKIPYGISKKELNRLRDEIYIVHFTIERPWTFLCKNRFRSLYRYYLKRSALFKGNVIEDFSFDKLPAWFSERAKEIYHDQRWLQFVWKSVKKSAVA